MKRIELVQIGDKYAVRKHSWFRWLYLIPGLDAEWVSFIAKDALMDEERARKHFNRFAEEQRARRQKTEVKVIDSFEVYDR